MRLADNEVSQRLIENRCCFLWRTVKAGGRRATGTGMRDEECQSVGTFARSVRTAGALSIFNTGKQEPVELQVDERNEIEGSRGTWKLVDVSFSRISGGWLNS